MRSIHVAALAFAFCSIALVDTRGEPDSSTIKLNVAALEHARQLIVQSHFVADGKGSWKEHRPSATDENEFIRLHGFGEYAKWYLAVDERHPEGTKVRYKFPFGDFKSIHRCGLLAAESRARQFGYSDVEKVAHELERAIQIQRRRPSPPAFATLRRGKQSSP